MDILESLSIYWPWRLTLESLEAAEARKLLETPWLSGLDDDPGLDQRLGK